MSSLIHFLKNLFAASPGRETAIALYSGAVGQARQPAFFIHYKIPDTLDGRFDLVVLHLYLLLHRLSAIKPPCNDVQMILQEAFFADLDRSMREIGVGDLAVGKHVKEMASAYFGRLQAYDHALDSGDEAELVDVLARNIYRGQLPSGDCMERLASYVRRQAAHLEAISDEDICAGRVHFLSPEFSETTKSRHEDDPRA
ncbi:MULTISPECIES: ubiquinol-cytochrome C chaperone family protein [unclassified Iodidimonas]|jgi:cytochrome b pre-mRNA-processing protein 3|uniref:ubiquinol-cytochrome C chaperone family protein n=1 Tax=unclassified Iodidimonas TaxID=2626145 RepID=UPI0024823E3D|nr:MULTISPECIES: ubiquinol-cytochrome C chaperone family protein [unclassified Iodidimonas]